MKHTERNNSFQVAVGDAIRKSKKRWVVSGIREGTPDYQIGVCGERGKVRWLLWNKFWQFGFETDKEVEKKMANVKREENDTAEDYVRLWGKEVIATQKVGKEEVTKKDEKKASKREEKKEKVNTRYIGRRVSCGKSGKYKGTVVAEKGKKLVVDWDDGDKTDYPTRLLNIE